MPHHFMNPLRLASEYMDLIQQGKSKYITNVIYGCNNHIRVQNIGGFRKFLLDRLHKRSARAFEAQGVGALPARSAISSV